jgi:hypothetical protein
MDRGARLLTLVAGTFAASCLFSPRGTGDLDADADAGDADADGGHDACVPAVEVCNGVDDDCNGIVDDALGLDQDRSNCGRCGNACATSVAGGAVDCVAGSCVLSCGDGFGSCDSDDGNGCETSLTTTADCGRCGQRCEGATPVCAESVAGWACADECGDGLELCGGSCVDTSTHPEHCGECGRACPERPSSSPRCVDRECASACDEGWDDCDDDPESGCERDVRTLDDCGRCDVPCALPNALASCATGLCALRDCAPGYDDCDGIVNNGCEAYLATSPTHCGACHRACTADERCVAGTCEPACGSWCTCAGSCAGAGCTCAPGCSCDLTCPAGTNCRGSCDGPDTTCVIGASDANDLQPFTCSGGARCEVSFAGAHDAKNGVVCTGDGTVCIFHCEGAHDCEIACADGAACMLTCDRATHNCRFPECDGTATTCVADEVVTCNFPCP